MENNRQKICPACKTEFITIYYQRRAADEPPDAVTYCKNCPLDTGKLSLLQPSKDNQSSERAVKKQRILTKRNLSYSANKTVVFEESRLVLYVQGNAAQKCYNKLLEESVVFDPIISTTIPVETPDTKKLVVLHLSSVFKNKALVTKTSKKIAPLISARLVDIYTRVDTDKNFENKSVIGYEHSLPVFAHCENVTIRTIKDGKQPYIIVLLAKTTNMSNNSQTQLLEVLQQILIEYGTETTIKSFIDPTTVSTLYVQSARAFDWASAPTEGYTFAWKPDGERFWYIKYGSVWLFSRRLLSGRITGWNMAKSISTVEKAGPILDVEVMIGHEPIFIDVLALESGIPTRSLRSLNDVLDIFSSMTTIDVPIHTRQYFSSESELLKTKTELLYPVDGTIGIENGSVTIIKLKNVKSIELKLLDNGNLVSAEDKLVLQSDLQSTYKPGSIIEIRFLRKTPQSEPEISETILRTDKTKANEYSVCQDIMKLTSAMPDTLARRRALLWCNSVRQKIHTIAANYSSGKGRVILDIGAGDGQAISDYSDDPTVTYLFIEPDKQRAKKLQKRLSEPGKGKCMYFDSADYIHKALASVAKGMAKYAIISDSIESVLRQEHCIKAFTTSVRYCVASFSISHVALALEQLALEGLEIIGCGYLYDNIDNGQYLINEHGFTMKKESDKIAKVKWGNDSNYTEFPITSKNFKDMFFIKRATTLVPITKDNELSLLNSVGESVYIITTRKYI